MVDWGNVPAFIAATLTGISLIIAAMTYRRVQRNSEREQASMVAGWMDAVDRNPDPAMPDIIIGWVLRMRNSSKLPIYRVNIERPTEAWTVRYSVIRPESTEPPDSTTDTPNVPLMPGMTCF